MIRYALRTNVDVDVRADFALRLLFEGIGVPANRVEIEDADLVYSREPPEILPEPALWIRAADACDWDGASVEVVHSSGMPIIRPRGIASGGGDARQNEMEDIVYSTYAIVTGALERGQPRDPWGVPTERGNAFSAHGVWSSPVVAIYCDYLRSRLGERLGAEIRGVARWPFGKKYAVVLSHDVDAPFTRASWRFYARRLRMNVGRRDMKAAVHGLLQIGKIVASTRRVRGYEPARDPNLRFGDWVELERSLPAKSCFYVAVTTSADPHSSPVDVTYDVRDPVLARELRKASDQGWEIGLHASVNAQYVSGLLSQELATLEEVLEGVRVRGVRHHYWALDRELPERTLWHHVEAGLSYDSSLGLNDAPGFRRGMAWPFNPFDRDRGEVTPIVEVPPTLMDGSIFYRPVTSEEGGALVRAHLAEVRRFGGAAVLDWHLEQLNPARLNGAGPALRDALVSLAGDSDVYWATPSELAEWWLARRRQIASTR